MDDAYITINDTDEDAGSYYDSVREAEAILAGEIPSTPETRDQVRRWLGTDKQVLSHNTTAGGNQQ